MRADFHAQAMPCRDVESDIEGFCVMMKRGGKAGSEEGTTESVRDARTRILHFSEERRIRSETSHRNYHAARA